MLVKSSGTYSLETRRTPGQTPLEGRPLRSVAVTFRQQANITMVGRLEPTACATQIVLCGPEHASRDVVFFGRRIYFGFCN